MAYIDVELDFEKVSFDCPHETVLKYLFDHNKEEFKEYLEHPLKFAYEIEGVIQLGTFGQCEHCGEHIRYILKDNAIQPKSRTCYEIKPQTVDIHVPSGRLIFLDWPRKGRGKELLSYLDEGKSINSFKGQVERIHRYAGEQIFHFFVGNTCPSVYKDGDSILIGNPPLDEEDEEIAFTETAEKEGYVCTDLWWVTAYDASVYDQLLKQKFPEEEANKLMKKMLDEAHCEVQMKPGVYRCYWTKHDEDAPLFGKMEWIGEIK